MPVEDDKLPCRARDTTVTVRSRTTRLDFTGHCTVRATTGSRLELLEIHLVAELPDAGGAEDGGSITVSGDNRRLTATIDQPGGRTKTSSARPPALGTTGAPIGPIDFVLASGPESTILRVENLILELEHSR
jgi:hypothetical protein